MWQGIKEIINQYRVFLLTTHVNPDGDGMGASSALTEYLISKGKKVRFVSDSKIPTRFSFLNYHDTHEIYDPANDYSDVEVVIVLDAHRKERVGRVADLFSNPNILKICIDHHELRETFADFAFINKDACSAGAMIYELLKELDFKLNLNAATGIYTSIICDTGRFSYASTDCKAHQIAEECMALGVDPDVMNSKLFQHISMVQINLLIHALQSMETHLDKKIIIQSLTLKDLEKIGIGQSEIENAELDYIHDFNKLIENTECVVLLRELPDGFVRVSLRSSSNLDVAKVMEKLGGGGHRNAAGVLIKGSILKIKKQITSLLEEMICLKVVAN